MNGINNRSESRLRYSWPVWFAENFDDMLSQGQMVDISRKGAAFTCYADKCPQNGQSITARFSVPRHHSSDPFDMENFVKTGHICRIADEGPHVKRIAVQFAEPLPFNPAEPEKLEFRIDQEIDEAMEALEAMCI
ncbi:MAG: PilZ domain-containing protein [Phycisphaerae bacterium]|nr:PilZ domain-containing protein [Phycisphaerae bacterium]